MYKIFSYTSARKIVFGVNASNEIGNEIENINGKKILILTDSVIVKTGILEKITPLLEIKGLSYHVWDRVVPEPDVNVVEDAIEDAEKGGFDTVIGLGGGSSLDTAKAVTTFVKAPMKLRDYIGKSVPKRVLNMILIPTTAGTGAEVSNVAVYALPGEDFKYAMYSPYFYPDVVLVDPLLTLTMPPRITASTGLDALCHAIEAYVSLQANMITDLFALKAIKLAGRHIREAYANGDNLKARCGMAESSLLAGLAFGNAGTVLGHAVGYAHAHLHHSPHGVCVAVTMPYVLEYNALSDNEKHIMIAKLLGEPVRRLPIREAALEASVAFMKLLEDLNIALNLKMLGVKIENFSNLAERVFRSPKHISRNPRKVTKEDMVKLFEKAYTGNLIAKSKI